MAARELPPLARTAPSSEPVDLRPVYRFGTRTWLLIAGVLGLVAWGFRDSLVWLWNVWTERPEFSHGPILPLVAAFLVWRRRDELARTEFRGSAWGVAVLGVALVAYLLGVLGAVYTLQQYAFVLVLAGLALAFGGTGVARQLAVPLLLLVLMVPPPNVILNNLSAQLQLLSSAIGVFFIRAAGISVFLEGNVIDLGGYRLQVVEACDGMRYLFPLMTLGLLIAYFYRASWWRRGLVFLASVPITVLMNSLRVGTIGLMVEHWGTGAADGFLHEFHGWMVFMLSTALLIGFAIGLNRLGAGSRPWREVFSVELPPRLRPAGAMRARALPPAFLVASAFVVAIVGLGIALPKRGDVAPDRVSFVDFPMQIGALHGQRRALDGEMLEALQLDDYVLADYSDVSGPGANVYVSYYSSQRNRRVVHSPRACIPGGGWHIQQMSTVALPDGANHATRMLITNGDARQLVYFWFDQRGRNLTSEWMVKWYLFWDALTRQRTDGAMVRLITPIGSADGPRSADERLNRLASQMAELLPKFVPR